MGIHYIEIGLWNKHRPNDTDLYIMGYFNGERTSILFPSTCQYNTHSDTHTHIVHFDLLYIDVGI